MLCVQCLIMISDYRNLLFLSIYYCIVLINYYFTLTVELSDECKHIIYVDDDLNK